MEPPLLVMASAWLGSDRVQGHFGIRFHILCVRRRWRIRCHQRGRGLPSRQRWPIRGVGLLIKVSDDLSYRCRSILLPLFLHTFQFWAFPLNVTYLFTVETLFSLQFRTLSNFVLGTLTIPTAYFLTLTRVKAESPYPWTDGKDTGDRPNCTFTFVHNGYLTCFQTLKWWSVII